MSRLATSAGRCKPFATTRTALKSCIGWRPVRTCTNSWGSCGTAVRGPFLEHPLNPRLVRAMLDRVQAGLDPAKEGVAMSRSTRQPSSPGAISFNIKESRSFTRRTWRTSKEAESSFQRRVHYRLGDEIFMLISLMDDPNKLPVAGRVIWLTPPGCHGNRVQGSASSSRTTKAGRWRADGSKAC